jgi:energy-coupling factor transporter ATP-binding protein EcfA2/riboflavin transporter FmnP
LSSDLLGQLFTDGPVHTFFVNLALALMVLAVGIWVLELSGRTVSWRGIVPNHVTWGSRSIALVAVCAALYIAGRPLQLQLIPGIGGLNPSFALAPVLVALFGLPAAVGVTFSMPIGDAISGALTLGSLAGCLGHTFVTWTVYKFCTDASLRTPRSWVGLYAGIVIGPLLHLIVVPGWLDFTHVLPPAVAWGGVTLSIAVNQIVIPAIVAPVLLYSLYPRVAQAGLYWRDTTGPVRTGRLAELRRSAPAGLEPTPPAVTVRARTPVAATDRPVVLEVEDLWLAYPTAEQPSLRGVDMNVRAGEFIGITGPSGAGKSTLLTCLQGLVPRAVTAETTGSVRVFGHDVIAAPLGAEGHRIGLVLQDAEAQIVGMTVAEDLAFGPENYGIDPAEIRRRRTEVLEMVGLAGMDDRDTFALSGGQKQRLAIASVLMLRPDVLLLDEPTSELDPMGKAEVFEVVTRLRRDAGTTIVMVEHELDRLAALADRLIVMSEGRIVAAGTPGELLADVELFLRTGGERPPAAAELQWRLRSAGWSFAGEPCLTVPSVVGRIRDLAGDVA